MREIFGGQNYFAIPRWDSDVLGVDAIERVLGDIPGSCHGFLPREPRDIRDPLRQCRKCASVPDRTMRDVVRTEPVPIGQSQEPSSRAMPFLVRIDRWMGVICEYSRPPGLVDKSPLVERLAEKTVGVDDEKHVGIGHVRDRF